MKTTDQFIRKRAELAGVYLSDRSLILVREKWENTENCNLDDLISGIRKLQSAQGCAQLLRKVNLRWPSINEQA